MRLLHTYGPLFLALALTSCSLVLDTDAVSDGGNSIVDGGDGTSDAGTPTCRTDEDCDDGIVCNGFEICDTQTRSCSSLGDPCNDDNPCTDDICYEERSFCENIANNLNCEQGEVCDAIKGCGNPACTERSDCDNANLCDGAEDCAQDTCVPGTALDCQNKGECEIASCDAQTGCVYTPDSTLCDDNIDCTIDACLPGGTCAVVELNHATCDDGLSCTVEYCDPEIAAETTGCVVTYDDASCAPQPLDPGGAAPCRESVCVGNHGDSKTGCAPAYQQVCATGLTCQTDGYCRPVSCDSAEADTCNDDNPCNGTERCVDDATDYCTSDGVLCPSTDCSVGYCDLSTGTPVCASFPIPCND